MKAVLLAGGKGTRLRPLTHTHNKHLIPIANKPMLLHGFEALIEAGIKDIVVNVPEDDKEVQPLIGDGSKWGVKVVYTYQDAPRGLAHALSLAESHIGGEDFVFLYGDNVFAGGLKRHIDKFYEEKVDFMLCLVKVPDPERFGIAEIKDGKVIRTVEKPKEYISDLAITGIQIYTSCIFTAIKHIKPTPPKPPRTIPEMDIPPANQWLLDNGYKCTYSIITGWWKDTGKPEALLEANKLVLEYMKAKIEGYIDKRTKVEGIVVLGGGSEISESEIKGPVIIGKHCRVLRSKIGPHVSISDRCVVEGSTLRNAIMLEKSQILNIRWAIEDSLLGKEAIVNQASGSFEKYKFMISDNSEVTVF